MEMRFLNSFLTKMFTKSYSLHSVQSFLQGNTDRVGNNLHMLIISLKEYTPWQNLHEFFFNVS